MNYQEHHDVLIELKEKLTADGKFKNSYHAVHSALTNTCAKAAKEEGPMPTVTALRKKLNIQAKTA